jgi:hypothetical protein
MDVSYLYQPAITSGVAAAIGSLALAAAAWRSKAVIARALAALRMKLFTRTGFFWTVNVIFMAVSVLHAGVFFGITGNDHDVPGVAQWLGFAVSFFLDLVTIILMQALLEAKYRSDEGRARQFLAFITITCATSTFANLAISLNDFDAAKALPHAPLWIQLAAPYVLASFPLFVILMSVAAEMIINVRPLDSLNAEEYEADEKKRIQLLQIRNDYLQHQADEELRTLQIRAKMAANKRLGGAKLPKSFRWPWKESIDVEALIAGMVDQIQAKHDAEITELKHSFDQRFDQVLDAVLPEEIIELSPVQSGLQNTEQDEAKTEAKPEQNDDSELTQVLKDYPQVVTEWLAKNRKTVTIEEIIETTGLHKKLISKATFQRAPRNQDLILITSVLEWLKTAPKPKQNGKDTDPLLPVKAGKNGHAKITTPLDTLVAV